MSNELITTDNEEIQQPSNVNITTAGTPFPTTSEELRHFVREEVQKILKEEVRKNYMTGKVSV